MEEKVILRKMLDECAPDLHMSEDSVYISFHSDKGKFWWTDRLSVKRNDNWVNVHSSFDIDKFRDILNHIVFTSNVHFQLEYLVTGYIIYNLKDDIITVRCTTKIESEHTL
jgi:hypothetical protein